MFKYSEQEIEKIKSNLQDVRDYCMFNIATKVDGNDELVATFQSSDGRECKFIVTGTADVIMTIGDDAIEFMHPEDTHNPSYMTEWNDAKELLPNWKEVKQQFQAAIEKLDAMRNAYTYGFEL